MPLKIRIRLDITSNSNKPLINNRRGSPRSRGGIVLTIIGQIIVIQASRPPHRRRRLHKEAKPVEAVNRRTSRVEDLVELAQIGRVDLIWKWTAHNGDELFRLEMLNELDEFGVGAVVRVGHLNRRVVLGFSAAALAQR